MFYSNDIKKMQQHTIHYSIIFQSISIDFLIIATKVFFSENV